MKQLAYRGRHGCESPRCTRTFQADSIGTCYGWHCAVCHEPSSHQGHTNCHQQRKETQ